MDFRQQLLPHTTCYTDSLEDVYVLPVISKEDLTQVE